MKVAIVLGILIILGGASIILSAFHIHFPMLRVALGLAFGWIGLSLVLTAAGVESRWLAFRGPQGTVKAAPTAELGLRLFREHDVIFSSSTVDLSALRPGDFVKVNVVFGEANVLYDPDAAIELKSTTAFGSTDYPDGSNVAFGERVVRTPAASAAKPEDIARVQVAAVFGAAHLTPSVTTHPTTLAPAMQ